jgi:hypothetical protein
LKRSGTGPEQEKPDETNCGDSADFLRGGVDFGCCKGACGQSAALRHALEAIAPSRHAQSGPSARPADRDQGDDHAAPRAIQMVCGKDRPAANRSAICPTPVSPD